MTPQTNSENTPTRASVPPVAVKRMKPAQYAEKLGIRKDSLYDKISAGKLDPGATVVRGANNRMVIHVDLDVHKPFPGDQ